MRGWLRRWVAGCLIPSGLQLKMGLGSRMLTHTRPHYDYLNIFLSKCSGVRKGGEDGWETSRMRIWPRGLSVWANAVRLASTRIIFTSYGTGHFIVP